MGGGNSERRQTQQAQTNYNNALTGATTESLYEKRRREFNDGILNWADSGDYREPPKGARAFYNFANVAEHKKKLDVLANTRGAGVSALGAGANPTLLALDKEHRDAEFEETAARDYQDTTSQIVRGAMSDNADMQNLDQSKRLNILGSTSGVYSSALSKPKQPAWWEKLIGGASAGAGALGSLGWQPLAGGLRRGGRTDRFVGKRVLTGEAGPELFVGDDGNVAPLGLDGPEVITPPPGYVVPNHDLPDATDPEISARAFDAAYRPAQEAPVESGGLMEAVHGFMRLKGDGPNREPMDESLPDGTPAMNVGLPASQRRAALSADPSEQGVEPSAQTSAPEKGMGPLSRAVNDSIAAVQPATRARRVTERPRFINPPKVSYDERGRPARSIHSPDGLEREDAYHSAVESYEPPKEKNWFKRVAPLVLQGFAAAGRGGDPVTA
ncbi:MAG: hypothetical protein H7Z38_00300, partial [Rubrivivax sp.]|nr:hypothetical protein [Pyrinomonadaceae bacterium]